MNQPVNVSLLFPRSGQQLNIQIARHLAASISDTDSVAWPQSDGSSSNGSAGHRNTREFAAN